MPETAFSTQYNSELDPQQLLARMRSVPIDSILPEDEISNGERRTANGSGSVAMLSVHAATRLTHK